MFDRKAAEKVARMITKAFNREERKERPQRTQRKSKDMNQEGHDGRNRWKKGRIVKRRGAENVRRGRREIKSYGDLQNL
jgi:hypothetical protein